MPNELMILGTTITVDTEPVQDSQEEVSNRSAKRPSEADPEEPRASKDDDKDNDGERKRLPPRSKSTSEGGKRLPPRTKSEGQAQTAISTTTPRRRTSKGKVQLNNQGSDSASSKENMSVNGSTTAATTTRQNRETRKKTRSKSRDRKARDRSSSRDRKAARGESKDRKQNRSNSRDRKQTRSSSKDRKQTRSNSRDRKQTNKNLMTPQTKPKGKIEINDVEPMADQSDVSKRTRTRSKSDRVRRRSVEALVTPQSKPKRKVGAGGAYEEEDSGRIPSFADTDADASRRSTRSSLKSRSSSRDSVRRNSKERPRKRSEDKGAEECDGSKRTRKTRSKSRERAHRRSMEAVATPSRASKEKVELRSIYQADDIDTGSIPTVGDEDSSKRTMKTRSKSGERVRRRSVEAIATSSREKVELSEIYQEDDIDTHRVLALDDVEENSPKKAIRTRSKSGERVRRRSVEAFVTPHRGPKGKLSLAAAAGKAMSGSDCVQKQRRKHSADSAESHEAMMRPKTPRSSGGGEKKKVPRCKSESMERRRMLDAIATPHRGPREKVAIGDDSQTAVTPRRKPPGRSKSMDGSDVLTRSRVVMQQRRGVKSKTGLPILDNSSAYSADSSSKGSRRSNRVAPHLPQPSIRRCKSATEDHVPTKDGAVAPSTNARRRHRSSSERETGLASAIEGRRRSSQSPNTHRGSRRSSSDDGIVCTSATSASRVLRSRSGSMAASQRTGSFRKSGMSASVGGERVRRCNSFREGTMGASVGAGSVRRGNSFRENTMAASVGGGSVRRGTSLRESMAASIGAGSVRRSSSFREGTMAASVGAGSVRRGTSLRESMAASVGPVGIRRSNSSVSAKGGEDYKGGVSKSPKGKGTYRRGSIGSSMGPEAIRRGSIAILQNTTPPPVLPTPAAAAPRAGTIRRGSISALTGGDYDPSAAKGTMPSDGTAVLPKRSVPRRGSTSVLETTSSSSPKGGLVRRGSVSAMDTIPTNTPRKGRRGSVSGSTHGAGIVCRESVSSSSRRDVGRPGGITPSKRGAVRRGSTSVLQNTSQRSVRRGSGDSIPSSSRRSVGRRGSVTGSGSTHGGQSVDQEPIPRVSRRNKGRRGSVSGSASTEGGSNGGAPIPSSARGSTGRRGSVSGSGVSTGGAGKDATCKSSRRSGRRRGSVSGVVDVNSVSEDQIPRSSRRSVGRRSSITGSNKGSRSTIDHKDSLLEVDRVRREVEAAIERGIQVSASEDDGYSIGRSESASSASSNAPSPDDIGISTSATDIYMLDMVSPDDIPMLEELGYGEHGHTEVPTKDDLGYEECMPVQDPTSETLGYEEYPETPTSEELAYGDCTPAQVPTKEELGYEEDVNMPTKEELGYNEEIEVEVLEEDDDSSILSESMSFAGAADDGEYSGDYGTDDVENIDEKSEEEHIRLKCGASKRWICGLCKYDNKSKHNFCGKCGISKVEALSSGNSAAETKTRTNTVAVASTA